MIYRSNKDVIHMGTGSSGKQPQRQYSSIPLVFSLLGTRHATDEEKRQRRETVTRFMNEAKAGDVYKTGAGFGALGGTFEVVPYNRSPNKLGIKAGNFRPVAMSRANVEKYLVNGATLMKKKR